MQNAPNPMPLDPGCGGCSVDCRMNEEASDGESRISPLDPFPSNRKSEDLFVAQWKSRNRCRGVCGSRAFGLCLEKGWELSDTRKQPGSVQASLGRRILFSFEERRNAVPFGCASRFHGAVFEATFACIPDRP